MKKKRWVALASLYTLAVLYMGQQADAAEAVFREPRTHGAMPTAERVVPPQGGGSGPYSSAADASASASASAGAGGLRTAGSSGGDCVAEPPPAARAAGLTKLAFCDDFSSAATIDLEGTLQAGFKWYITGLPYGFVGSGKDAYRVSGGVLSFHPEINQAQLSFLSAVVPRGSTKPVGWYIDRQVGGWYVEARMAHIEKSLGEGFPAFWTMDMCHLYRYPAPCAVFVEPDFYEFIDGRETRAVHRHQDPTGTRASKLDTWGTTRPTGSWRVNWQDFNTVAMRALPEVITHYVNDREVTEGRAGSRTSNGTFFWVGDVVAGPRMSGGGVGRYPVIFGSGPQMPFKLDWVRVWVKP